MLILVCGLPGSGKTTLSKILSKELGASYFSTDSIRKEILAKRTYSKDEKNLIYCKMLLFAKSCLEKGKIVVLDGTFYKESIRKKFILLSKKLNRPYYIIRCQLDDNNTKIRIKKRKNDKSDANFSIYLKLKKSFQNIKEPHLLIDAIKDKKDQLSDSIFYLLKNELNKEYKLIETHISYVFLSDKYAYKIKKPVKFSFLDFSTKEKRRYYINRELALNKKISPSIYLGVENVSILGNKFSIGNKGIFIEPALKMKKMDDKKKMDNLLNNGKINEKEIISLAKEIFKFHKKAKVIFDKKYNSSKMLLSQINDITNFKKIFLSQGLESQFDFMLLKCNDFIKNNTALFENRQKEGKIRECHGDLHTGNIFFEKKPFSFDCIEFNNEFSYIDILSDLSFLAMDLDAKGKKQLSARFIQTYFNLSKESDIKLINLYKCYRANVRAKIAAIECLSDKKSKSLKNAKMYLNLAFQYAKNL